MISKKSWAIVLGFVLVLSLLVGVVSAITPGEVFDNGVKKVAEFLKFIIGGTTSVTVGGVEIGALFIARLLLMILIFAVLIAVLKQMPILNDGWPMWVTAIIVSILAIRFTPDDFIVTMIFPSGALGAAIAAVVPFIIFFWFVESSIPAKMGRTAAWAVFAAFFLMLWWYRIYSPASKDLPALQGQYAVWVYPIAAVLCVVMIWLDKSLHAWFVKQTLEGVSAAQNAALQAEIQAQINWAHSVATATLGNTIPPWPATLGAAPVPVMKTLSAGGIVTNRTLTAAREYEKQRRKAFNTIL